MLHVPRLLCCGENYSGGHGNAKIKSLFIEIFHITFFIPSFVDLKEQWCKKKQPTNTRKT